MHAILNSFSRDVSRYFDDYFKQHNLATPYIELLLLIDERENISQKEISKELNLAPSTITRFINKLNKRGLVEKKMNGRMATIRLSKKGNELVPVLRTSYNKAMENLRKKLGDKFVHTTEQLLKHGSDQLNR